MRLLPKVIGRRAIGAVAGILSVSAAFGRECVIYEAAAPAGEATGATLELKGRWDLSAYGEIAVELARGVTAADGRSFCPCAHYAVRLESADGGAFSFGIKTNLATMIVNEVHMAHRKNMARAGDRKVSLDAPGDDAGGDGSGTLADTLVAPVETTESIDADWQKAVLRGATEHVLTKTALSDRDRKLYRAYALEGRDIADVAREFGLSRNNVSQIKTRIDKRIVAFGRQLAAGDGRVV